MQAMSNKKVAILYSGGRGIAGIEKYLIDLFKNIDKDVIELELLSLGKWGLTMQLIKSGEKVQIFSPKRISLKTVREVGHYCVTNKKDLLVSQGVVANAYARMVAKFYAVNNLVTAHSDPSSEYSNPVLRMIYLLVDKVGQPVTVRYIAVSKFIKSRLVKSGVPARKIDTVYNGTDFADAGQRAHKRLVIGSLGRLENVKGYDLLIKAFAQIDNKRLRLKIAGDGGELENLKKLATELCVDDRVEFVGYRTDYIKFLDSIDVYVQPSRSEGFGLSVIEAMSRNLPVVVTPAGSLSEIVQDGKTGYICKDFEIASITIAISKAVENYESSKQIGENARAFVIKNFNIKQWVENTEKVYAEASR